ncbi:MAG: insulinase family protein, partial [Rhodospirillales bacterium]|nr:insulinase family protein [Rhodospirillales bacterium]
LDQLGVQRSTSVETQHIRLSATMIGSKAGEALPLLLAMATAPNLDTASLEPSRDLCMQSIDALADEPQQRVMLQLKERFRPQPLGRSPLGVREHLHAATLDHVQQHWQSAFVPDGAILAFAGHFDLDALCAQVAELTTNWQGQSDEVPAAQPGARGYVHEKADTSQVHIGLAYEALPEPEPNAMHQKAAVAVLSGGMSGRLFTEVREKRGLCYAVYASYAGWRSEGAVMGYAGTTTPRAQETLDVFRTELNRLAQGIDQSEFDRAIVGMKSRLVMQGESTSARAAAIAMDQHLLDHPRTLDELTEKVDKITFDSLDTFVRDHPPSDMTIVTIGPEALKA